MGHSEDDVVTKYFINQNELAESPENFGIGLIQNHLYN